MKPGWTKSALLTVDEMYRADKAAIDRGVTGAALMEAAGAAIADAIGRRWTPRPTAVLCGPGNNGGDGFVVARVLAGAGWPVTVALLGVRAKLTGDAAVNADRWTGPIRMLEPGVLDDTALVVDALFGAGLGRALSGPAKETIERINARKLPCVGVDIPSGVYGDTGEILGAAPSCTLTVTFFRKKPGHLLMPGRERMGDIVVADIGIPEEVLAGIGPRAFENGPTLWSDGLPRPKLSDHKYSRGHALISGGSQMTGAARLAARGAMRIGAGMVTIACHPDVRAIYAADRAGLLVRPVADAAAFDELLEDGRINAVLVGPGAGGGTETRDKVLAALRRDRATVLDADAITVFTGDAEALFTALQERRAVLTPHEGEFARVFTASGDKTGRARHAASISGAVMLLKGADTVIAAPDGTAVINASAPPDLAVAGAGDVLAGMIAGLLAQGMHPFEASCAATWIHGRAAQEFGPGLIADDLPEMLPAVRRLLANP